MSDNKRSVIERIEIVKNKDRPTITDYIENIFTGFFEMHGDRAFGDDSAIIGGIAYFDSLPVTVIGHAKGKNTKENIQRNFAMPRPEGYRKSLRLMKQAEKFGRPVICFVDTPGAHCNVGAEERGQGEAIARNLMEMMSLKIPIVTVLTGEGGSGGALALSVANEIYMLENAVFSVISPKGFASILWKDSSREKEAAELLKMTAQDLLNFSIIEGVLPEPAEGAHSDKNSVYKTVSQALKSSLSRLCKCCPEELAENRYNKFRRIGAFTEQ